MWLSSSGTTGYGYVLLNAAGTTNAYSSMCEAIPGGTTGTVNNGTRFLYFETLAQGTYTMQLLGAVDAGKTGTLDVISWEHVVIALAV